MTNSPEMKKARETIEDFCIEIHELIEHGRLGTASQKIIDKLKEAKAEAYAAGLIDGRMESQKP